MDWYLAVLKKYAVFQGRARRTEFWMFFFFNAMIVAALTLVDEFAGFSDSGPRLLTGVYGVAVLLPTVSVAARRLHDIDRSGIWLLLLAVPVVGPLFLLALMAVEGRRGNNRFGPDPKAGADVGLDHLAAG